jgi:3-oxoacyl-[acyl-carrier protein] reductase
MNVDLAGKVAVVTGAGNGIGRAIALAFARQGADVVAVDVEEAAGSQVVDDIRALGRRSHLVRADITDAAAMAAMAGHVVERFGAIHLLVNNAGVSLNTPLERRPFHEFDLATWDRVIRTNLTGSFHCARAVAGVMVNRGYGKIVNIGSVMGLVPTRNQAAYAASKAGLLQLTRLMALDLAPHGINVNAIAPGSILTRTTKTKFYENPDATEKVESILSHIPMKRPGQPEDVANAALFLVSDTSSYVTGHVLTVDGGWTCGFTRDW